MLAENAFIQVALQHLTNPVLACDATGHVRYFNDAFAATRPKMELGDHICASSTVDGMFRADGRTPLQPEQLPIMRALAGETVVDEAIVIRGGDERRIFDTSARPILGLAGELLGAVLVKHDVTGEQQAKAELLHRAFNDELTGLGNRAQIAEELQVLFLSSSPGRSSAVLMLDVDNFKLINDSLGHAAGDLLLVEVAGRIRSELRAGERAARLGGDEFVVFLHIADAVAAFAVAERLLVSLEAPVLIGETWLAVSASIGIAMSDSAEDVTNLLGAADFAMYVAKQRGKAGIAMFEPSMQQVAQDRLSLETDLRRAVRNQELHLVYQPVVDLKTGALAGVEALVRWHDDVRGDVSPAEFIPIAEQTGLILPLGEWVLREAVSQLQRWNQQTPGTALVVNVNVSTRQLERRGLLTTVDDLLAHGLDPAQLVLEITETALGHDDDAATETLYALHDRGIRLAVDDFGTGYSSLSRLRAAPVSQLKIDRSFVNEIVSADADVPIIDATVAMSEGLGLGVIAEGIETHAQLHYLRKLGCRHAQGYLLARPLEANSISRMLTGNLPWSHLFGSGSDAAHRAEPAPVRLRPRTGHAGPRAGSTPRR